MKESELEKMCILYSEQYPTIACFKIKAGGQRHSVGTKQFFKKSSIPGFPDILLCAQGRFIGVELKTEIGRQSDVQKKCQEKIEKAEGLYYIIRNFEDFKNLIQGFL